MKYSVNMIQDLLKEEKRIKIRTLRRVTYMLLAFGILLLALFYAALKFLYMKQLIDFEQAKLDKIEEEYNKYQNISMVVNRMDIELLDKLQHDRIFWTKKLVATALYLPENYWIEEIYYDKIYSVNGYGYTVPEQKQLITMDSYLNMLRKDSTFNNDFTTTSLNLVVRNDEDNIERVLFKLSASK